MKNSTLDSTWWLTKPHDLEHKQYVLLAYIRDAKNTFGDNKIEPYFNDVRDQLKNLECYNSIGGLLKKSGEKMTKTDQKLVEYVSKLPDNHPDKIEVQKIITWSLDQLKDLQQMANDTWRYIESSLLMEFLGNKPKKVTGGYMFIRYPGSWIVETYKFRTENENVISEFVCYDENKADTYDDVLAAHKTKEPNTVYITVEPTKPFDTKHGLLPVVHQVLKSKVITKFMDSSWRME